MDIVVRKRNWPNYLLGGILFTLGILSTYYLIITLIQESKFEWILLFISLFFILFSILLFTLDTTLKMVVNEKGITASSMGWLLRPKNTSRFYPWKNAICLDHDGWSYLAGYHLEIADEHGSQVTIILNWFHTNRASALAAICDHIDSSKITERAEKSLRRILRKNDK